MITTLSFSDFDINWSPNSQRQKISIAYGRMNADLNIEDIRFKSIGEMTTLMIQEMNFFITYDEYITFKSWIENIKLMNH